MDLSNSISEPPVPHSAVDELPLAAPSSLTSRDVLRLLPRAWPFIRPYQRHLIGLLLLTLPGLGVGLVALTLIRIFFDVIGHGQALTALQARMLLLDAGAPRETVLRHA